MTPELVMNIGRQAIEMTLVLSGPLLLAALVIVLILAGPWMLQMMVYYIRRLFESIPQLIG